MVSTGTIEESYEEIKTVLEKSGFVVNAFTAISYGIQFRVESPECSGTLRIFRNKKGRLKIDYSQIKGQGSSSIAHYIEGLPINGIEKSPSADLGLPIIGSDESGKGDYFGPLVAAAVYVDEKAAVVLDRSGVRDSKELSESKIAELASMIPRVVHNRLAVIEISPERYNQLYKNFTSENKNLNTLLAWGHAKAIEVVLGKVECRNALADQFADERFILSKLQERGRRIELHQMPRAEKNIAVAAASILARQKFVSRLTELSRNFGIDLPKGASDQSIAAAKIFVNIHGRDMLGKVAKLHFKTTESIMGQR